MYLSSDTFDPFEIIVGTYEQYVLGYKVENVVNEYKMEKSFATHSHTSSVRSIASNKYYLASAGADDCIQLYDMKQRIESGRLMHHNDTINCITFTPDASHLFSCSNDGTIAAIRCGNWQIEKHWQKPHKGLAVNAIAIHPSGKLALSTGADGVLRTWNLIKGRQAYATNLVPRLKLDAKNVTVLKWSPNGEKYLLAANQTIDIYSVEVAGVDDEIKYDSKVVCVEFLNDDLIAVGLENGHIKFYDLLKNTNTMGTIAHDIRVKCIAHVGNDLLVTASSSGEIKLWRYSENAMSMLKSVNCGARIICLSLATIHKMIKTKEEDKSNKDIVLNKNQNKIRMRREVVVEDEEEETKNGWTVIDVTNVESTKSSKKKSNKNKRILETDDSSKADSVPLQKEKKKKKKVSHEKNKKNKRVDQSSTEDEIGIKKKKRNKRIQDVDELLVNENNNNNIVSLKKRKECFEENDKEESDRKKKKKALDVSSKKSTFPKNMMSKESVKHIHKTSKKRKDIAQDRDTLPKKKKKKQ